MPRKRRQFTREFELETVKLVKQGLRSLTQVARDLDLTESALRNWVRPFDIDAGTREGTTPPPNARSRASCAPKSNNCVRSAKF